MPNNPTLPVMQLKIKKLGETRAHDPAKLPDVSNVFLYQYGVTQWYNDLHASVLRGNYPETEQGAKDWRAAVNAKIDAGHNLMVAGTPPGHKADPIAVLLASFTTDKGLAAQFGTALAANPEALAALMAALPGKGPEPAAESEAELPPMPGHAGNRPGRKM